MTVRPGAPAPPREASPTAPQTPAGAVAARVPASARSPAAGWPAWLALAAIVAGGLALRAHGIGHGLPFVYHADEAFHFTSIAVRMFGDGLDPGYFQNPSGFTYLVHLALAGEHGLVGAGQGALAQYAGDPTAAFLTARWVATALCMAGVVAVFAVGRRLWGPAEGVVAAAVLSFAFLPVAYSRYAVTDVGVLLPVALALLGVVKVAEDGRRRWYVLAGLAAGVAVGFKYTAGLVVVPLLLAAVPRARRDPGARLSLALALGVALAAFAVTTPYFFVDLHKALYQLKIQRQSAETPKLGQSGESPFAFYPRSLTWALGWGPALAAAVGVVVEARRARRRALLLVSFPLLLTLYLCLDAERYFARWLMPVYPALALLAGVGLAHVAARLGRGRALPAAALLGVLLAAALAQPIAAGIRTGGVLSRTDTRQLARDFLIGHVRPGARIVVDPAIPRDFLRGRFALGFGAPAKAPGSATATPTRYLLALSPARIERYRRAGYCVVVTMSDVQQRARAERLAPALAYYRALPREGRRAFAAGPYRRGAGPVPFDFDFSTHLFYPRAYERPGPEVAIFRLHRCRQRFGADANRLRT